MKAVDAAQRLSTLLSGTFAGDPKDVLIKYEKELTAEQAVAVFALCHIADGTPFVSDGTPFQDRVAAYIEEA